MARPRVFARAASFLFLLNPFFSFFRQEHSILSLFNLQIGRLESKMSHMANANKSVKGGAQAWGAASRLIDGAASEGAEASAAEQTKGAAGAALLLPKTKPLAAADDDADDAVAGMLPKLTLPNAVVAVPLLS
jgi:hypothetical protein